MLSTTCNTHNGSHHVSGSRLSGLDTGCGRARADCALNSGVSGTAAKSGTAASASCSLPTSSSSSLVASAMPHNQPQAMLPHEYGEALQGPAARNRLHGSRLNCQCMQTAKGCAAKRMSHILPCKMSRPDCKYLYSLSRHARALLTLGSWGARVRCQVCARSRQVAGMQVQHGNIPPLGRALLSQKDAQPLHSRQRPPQVTCSMSASHHPNLHTIPLCNAPGAWPVRSSTSKNTNATAAPASLPWPIRAPFYATGSAGW